jgi:hypothetical protein
MDEQKPLQDRDPGPQSGIAPIPPSRPVPGRRRLLTGGLSATGVVLTLASRPVLGQMTCQTPSAHGSVNASQEARQVVPADPLSIAAWISADPWPGSLVKNDVRFKDKFPGGVDRRMIRLLIQPAGQYDLEKLFIASYLNIITTPPRIPSSCLSESELLQMWGAVKSGGRYRPTSLNWDTEAVKLYLRKNTVG